jgi:hypothetical protein
MGVRGFRLAAAALALVAVDSVVASSGGITGVSGSPGDGFATCSGCHSGGAQTGSISVGGVTSVAPSSATAFTMNLSSSNATAAGYNLSATAGTLAAGASSQLSGGQVTHTAKQFLSGSAASWGFSWTAPSTVGVETFYYCVNRVNNDSATSGDSPTCSSRTVNVNTAPNAVNDTPTAVLEGSASNCITVVSNDTSGTSGNESGDSITLSSLGTPSQGGTVAIGGGACTTSQIRYTPPGSDFSGTETVTYTIRDSFNSASFQDTATVTLTVTDVNDTPTLNAIANPAAINEDAVQQNVSLSGIGDGSAFESQTLAVTASSSNTAVIPNPTVTYTSANTTGSIAYTPVANANGSAIITVTVTDGGGTANGGDNNVSQTFTVTVNSVNDEPTLTLIADPAAINEDATQQTVNLSGIGAGGGESQTLTVTASSSNTALIPNPTVTYTSANATGSLAYTPVANANGSAVITVTVTDNGGTANGGDNTVSDTFTVTVNAQNDPPTAVSDTDSVAKNSTGNVLAPLANDTDVDAGDTKTIVSVGTPSNGGSVSIVGAGANNTLSYSPATNYSGTETFSYTMQDAAGSQSSTTFTVTVGTGVAPVAGDDTGTVLEDSSGNSINVLANDTDADAGDTKEIVAVNGSSSFPVATTNGSVALSGTGAGNTLLYTPTANFFGSDTFTYTVRDAGLLTDVGSVTVTVTGINDEPTLTAIGNPVAILEDATQQTVNLSGIGAGTGESQTLTVTASSSNTALIPNPTVTYTSASATGSLAYTPVANANGSAVITVTVTDSGGTANGGDNAISRTFTVTVTAVNDAPTLNAIGNPAAIDEDAAQQTVNLAGIGAGGGESQTLTVTASSSNTALIPHPTVTYTSANATGSLAYTPVGDASGSAVITVTVSDNGGTANGGVNSAQRTFTVNVNAVNDTPVVAAIANQAVADNQLFSYTVAVTDDDGETSFTYSLADAPGDMSIDSNGTITWTPPIGTSGVFTPTVQAEDAASAMGTRQFQLTVSSPDSDNDGMPDSYEDLYPGVLDKNDPTDANEDPDGDGLTNLEEYADLLDPTIDDVAPALAAPADLIVPATGYYTVVDLGQATASDGKDGVLSATSDWTLPVVRPGRYTVNWSVQDQAGNIATDTQQVDVLPLASFNVDQAADGVSGAATVTVTLNGTPPEYPATVDYTVNSALGGLSDGTFTIASGTTASLPVAFSGGATGSVTLTMSAAAQATIGPRDTHTITVTNGNIAPAVTLAAAQGAYPRLLAYQDDGVMSLSADAFDPNANLITYDWSGSSDALGVDAETSPVASFDASGLSPGAYPVSVTVSDGVTQTTSTMLIVVLAGASTDVDVDADGIPDSVDSVTDDGSLLENQTGNTALAERLETEPGLSLRRGSTSLAAGRTGALIAMSDLVAVGVGEGGLALGADSYENVGGLFDFEIHGLAAGGTASVVLPLQAAIRSGSVYRKFDPIAGWHDFALGTNDAVASATSAFGQCPGPASDAYVAGLQPFADCVRLTLTDGGPNDADGAADGVIRDPGGVAFTATSVDDETTSVSSGAFLALWLPLALLLRLRRRAGVALLALAALLSAGPAQAENHVRIHVSGDVASGFDNNVNNAQKDADIRESGFASANGNLDYQRMLSLYTTLLLRGSVLAERWNSFEGLSNAKATAMARVLYRGDGDFYTPTYAAWLSAAAWEFDSAIRDSNEYRAGAFISENLTTQITGRFTLGANRRESDGLVFDLSGYSASVNLDWVPAPRAVIYTGYQYYVGDVTSTASQSFWIVEAAEAIEADDAFGGLDGGLFAYRLDAKAQIATLGFNYAFSRKLSADVQGQYINTRATSRIDYERVVGVVSLLARF